MPRDLARRLCAVMAAPSCAPSAGTGVRISSMAADPLRRLILGRIVEEGEGWLHRILEESRQPGGAAADSMEEEEERGSPETGGATMALRWDFMPQAILSQIFSYLSLSDRCSVTHVCPPWEEAVKSKFVWQYTDIRWVTYEDLLSIDLALPFIKHIRHLKIVFEQSKEGLRHNVIQILARLSKISRKLESLNIGCCGEKESIFTNAYTISSHDILNSIVKLSQKESQIDLQHVDLRNLPFPLNDVFAKLLATGSPNLRSLYINNRTLENKVTPDALIYVLTVCPKMNVLGAFWSSLSEDVFRELMKPERPPLHQLDIYCMYTSTISNKVWRALCQRHPSLSVSIKSACNVSARTISRILKPSIPVSTLHLNTYNEISNQLILVSTLYTHCLTKLVIRPMSSRALDLSLIELAGKCTQLEEVHCYCVVGSDVVQAFLKNCPLLKKYTLTVDQEKHSWKATYHRPGPNTSKE